MEHVDRDVLYSIFDKDPKRAEAYWFISTNVLDDPDELNYQVETYGTDFIFRVKLNMGYKCNQRVNLYLRQIVGDLQASGEMPAQHKKYSIYEKGTVGGFKFCIILKAVPHKSVLTAMEEAVLNVKYAVRRRAGSKTEWYGLDTSTVITETVPMSVGGVQERKMTRISSL